MLTAADTATLRQISPRRWLAWSEFRLMLTKRIGYPLLLLLLPLIGLSGLLLLADYSYRSREANDAVTDCWPEFLAGVAPEGQCVVLFYHPHCPCTRATVRSLERMASRCSSRMKWIAYAYCPENEADSWIDTATTRRLREAIRAEVRVDRGGQACVGFGARTSGHIAAYDASGRLLFSGGITPSRGHEGDCIAAATLVRCLGGEETFQRAWPVFGCQIVTDGGKP